MVDRVIIRIYRARPALQGEFSNVEEKVQMLSTRAGVALPQIYITEQPLPGSLIIGKSREKTKLVVPVRSLNLLDDRELGAMLAYNIVQINNDIRMRTLAALIAGISTMAASVARWGAVFTGFGDYNDPAPKLFGTFVMGLAAPPAAAMIQSVAEEDYDLWAAMLCGSPDALVSAIEQLEKSSTAGYPSLGFLCLIEPQKENFFEYLFSIHPPKEIRIKNLMKRGRTV